MRAVLSLAAALLLAACGGESADGDGVGGVTADEAAALDNAAEMLDASPDDLGAPPDEALGNAAIANDVAP